MKQINHVHKCFLNGSAWMVTEDGNLVKRTFADHENPQANFSDLKMRINYKSIEGVLKEALVSFFNYYIFLIYLQSRYNMN